MEKLDRENAIDSPERNHRSSLLQVRTYNSNPNSSLSIPVSKPLSPLGDESVRGYATDVKPEYNGAKEITVVVRTIEASGVLCCIVGEAALIYYGARRVMFDWLICVPDEDIDRTRRTFNEQSDRYESFRPNVLNSFGSLNSCFPRFKLVGKAVFFVIMSTQACHLHLMSHTIEYDRWIRIPYPKLPEYAQSLLDTWSLSDLEDLVDGMNLTMSWGEDNLKLEGNVDQQWACWRASTLAHRELNNDELPRWSTLKRNIWNRVASPEAKKRRQGWKTKPEQLTRFWSLGQQDPREKYKDYP